MSSFPEVYVGTSGWVYDWNPNGLKWYVRESGFNAVELNMSFYRFPYASFVRNWLRHGSQLRWSIKVHRSITHYSQLGKKALSLWNRFRGIFKPMDDLIDFYLLQLPPSFRLTRENLRRLETFSQSVNLGERMAVEFRSPEWFTGNRGVEICKRLGVTFVSTDSPEFGTIVDSSNNVVYMRLHGRITWYAYHYKREELVEIALNILQLRPKRVFVFFNNNHDMLVNGREMKDILLSLREKIND
ncbi:MAG: DUF72 domain-containing protein [Thermoprotei archaeon]|nr:MAG: DUF72 domain-containing protein [Thermoprotei archaeon]RLE82941.1 MAG: DUF72 domain-containing protein [Thermoprotei archaeon]RLE99437.1 MAG: DUF72 domain-containing protein [Thermoprotei archaeon]